MSELTHFDDKGNAVMVDITNKAITERTAVSSGFIQMNTEAFEAVKNGNVKKGDVLGTARIAGIMAVKRTWELIPLCHQLLLTSVKIDFELYEDTNTVKCTCTVKLTGKTGAEMEAMVGVNIALLTVYDMCKAIDKSMVITAVCLEEKSGGKSGHYINTQRSFV